MAYDPTNQKLSITGGLSIDEVRRCLSMARRDLGTLAKNGAINIWAKYKPVNAGVNNYGLTGKASGSEWWKGVNGKCGINFTAYNNLGTLSSGFLHELSQGNLAWTRETLNAPFRLTDFDGYWHLAVCPIQKCGASKLLVDDSGNLQIDFQSILFPEGTENLQFEDIASAGSAMSDWYFSLLIIKNTSTYFVASANNKVGNRDFSVVFTSMKQNLGTYRIFPFLSSYKLVQGGSAQAGQFCSIGVTEAEVIEVALATSSYQLIVSGSLDGSRRYIDIDLTLKNNSSGSHNFQGVTVQLSRSTGPNNPPGTVLTSWTFSNHTVSGGGTYSYATTRKTYTVPDDGAYYWLSAYANGVSVDRYKALLESPIL